MVNIPDEAAKLEDTRVGETSWITPEVRACEVLSEFGPCAKPNAELVTEGERGVSVRSAQARQGEHCRWGRARGIVGSCAWRKQHGSPR